MSGDPHLSFRPKRSAVEKSRTAKQEIVRDVSTPVDMTIA